MVSSPARLHGDRTRRHVGREAQNIAAADPLAQENSTIRVESNAPLMMRSPRSLSTMGIAPGGTIVQKIYPDTYGFHSWDSDGTAQAEVHIVNSLQFSSITGEAAPPPVISATDYIKRGFPWFELWDEERGDLDSQSRLEDVKSISTVATSGGLTSQEPSIQIPQDRVKKIRRPRETRSPQ